MNKTSTLHGVYYIGFCKSTDFAFYESRDIASSTGVVSLSFLPNPIEGSYSISQSAGEETALYGEGHTTIEKWDEEGDISISFNIPVTDGCGQVADPFGCHGGTAADKYDILVFAVDENKKRDDVPYVRAVFYQCCEVSLTDSYSEKEGGFIMSYTCTPTGSHNSREFHHMNQRLRYNRRCEGYLHFHNVIVSTTNTTSSSTLTTQPTTTTVRTTESGSRVEITTKTLANSTVTTTRAYDAADADLQNQEYDTFGHDNYRPTLPYLYGAFIPTPANGYVDPSNTTTNKNFTNSYPYAYDPTYTVDKDGPNGILFALTTSATFRALS